MPRALIESTFGSDLPFNDWSGIDYLEATPRRVRLSLGFARHVADASGGLAEGALLALADTAGGMAAVAAFGGRQQVATATLQMSHLAPLPPGRGVLAEGTVLAHDAETTLVDVRLTVDEPTGLAVRQARVRLIRTYPSAAASGPAAGASATARRTVPGDAASSFAEAIGFRAEPPAGGVVPFQPVLIGNASRRMIHGGVVAAGMAEALVRPLDGGAGSPAAILDSTTDFMRPALSYDMTISTRTRRAGRRYVFADAEVRQDHPGTGPVVVASMRATLARPGVR